MSDIRTTHWFDFPALREAVIAEKAVRGCTATLIVEQTGVNAFSVNRFLGYDGYRLSIDGAISLAEWCNKPLSTFIRKRRSARRHIDTYEQRQLRNATAFLASKGISLEKGESPVDALMRALAEAQQAAQVVES